MHENDILHDFQSDRFDRFYRLVWPGLVLYANNLLGPQQELLAEDHVQDAVFSAWERKNSFNSAIALKYYLYTSIKNSVVSSYRKNSARLRYIEKLDNTDEFNNSVIDQEAQSIIFNAINELPDKIRRIFELNFMEGLKIKEIAERMKLTESSIKKYKSQGLAILRLKLDPRLFSLLLAVIS